MSSTHISNQSLQWTRPLLDELFEDVRQAIERFGDEDRERQESDLNQAVEACEKVAGSLAVMEFKSGQLIAEAMGLALDALMAGEAREEGETIARILEATAILPDYLDYLESTQRDTPVVVLPTINDLRASAGQPALDEAEFFRPEVADVQLPEPQNEAELAELRRDYQHALRGFLINHQDDEAVDTLMGVALKIRDSRHAPAAIRRVGWSASALCEALKAQRIAGGPNITRLFARTDVMLKEFAESSGDDTLTAKADDLCRSMLFQIALSQADTDLAQEVNDAFDLAAHTPDQLAQAKVFLAGRNRALFSAVTKAAREDLAKIKEALGTQLERDSDPEVLNQQTALLESVGESLSMLGLDHLATRVKAQSSKLSDLGGNPEDPALLMVARELLVVESQLEESFGLAADLGEEDDLDEADATLLPPSEQRRVVKQMVKEALEDLTHAKHLLDAINRNKADDNALEESEIILERISGALRMANLDESAYLLDAAGRVAADHLAPDNDSRDPVALEALAETLTVTEFYLDGLTSRDDRGDRYLNSARERLSALGYLGDLPEPAVEEDVADNTENDVEVEFEASELSADDTLVLEEDDALELDESDDSALDDTLELEDFESEIESFDDESDADDELTADAEAPIAPVEQVDSGAASAFDDFDIVEIFLEEFDQELESLREIVPEWQDQPTDEEQTVTIRRAFHSLKGSGRMAGAMEIGEFSWNIENMLNRILDGQLIPEPRVTSLVAAAVEMLPSMRARLSGEGEQAFDEAACMDLAERAGQAADGKLESGESQTESVEAASLPPELEDLDSTLIELMVKELSENLESMERWLNDSQESGHTPEIDDGMVRIVHTMKGTMRLAPIGDETETAQILETYLEELAMTHSAPSAAGMDVMTHCAELFRLRLERLRGESVEDDVFDTAVLAGELRDLHSQAHRERIGEQSSPSEAPSGHDQAAPDDVDFSSEVDLDDSTGGFDFFDVDAEEVAVDDESPAEHAEGDAAADLASAAPADKEDVADEDEESLDDAAAFADFNIEAEVAEPSTDVAEADTQGSEAAEADSDAVDDSEAIEAETADADAEVDLEPVEGSDSDELEDDETGDVEFEQDDQAEDLEAALEHDEDRVELDADDMGINDLEAVSEDDETTERGDAEADPGEDTEAVDVDSETEIDGDIADQPMPDEDEDEPGLIEAETDEAESDDEVEDDLADWEKQALAAEEAAASGQTEFITADDSIEQIEEEVLAEPEAETEDDDSVARIDYSEVNDDLLEAFLEEGQELLEHADGVLQQWRETPDDKSLVTALQRDLHTIKGSSRMVGLNPIGQVAHVMEELLEGIAAGLKDTTKERIDALETGCDHLHLMIDAVNERQPVPMRAIEDLFADQADEIDDAADLPEFTADVETLAGDESEERVARSENLRVPSSLIDELVNYAGEISIFRSRLEQQISVFRNNVGEVDETVIRLRDQLRKLEIETEAQILARYEREHGPADEEFDPLELDRYSTIQQLSRALAESVNDLTSLTGILDDATRQSETLLMQQSRVNTELQEGLMQARMVSFNTLLPRFRRVIRNAAREVGKKAQLRVTLAGEGELDRNVLERITAPIEHLLRNAISHGIEMPDERRQADKPETGTVSIDVSREATELVMRITDDGAGLNLDRIHQRALERGLINKNDDPDDATLTQMIFQSGFTTAEQVSELSGRGIGMDVVANEVRQIGGSVTAQSSTGEGAMFVIRIPLSLTVMQAIMVRASDRQFAIPLQSVRGVTRILADEWTRATESSEPVQEYAGDAYPLLELEPQLDFQPEEVGSGTLSLLMVEAGDERAALRVSDLLGHREIVIKPVGPQISSIPGILGGTITGDGQVVPILDIGPLIRRAFAREILPGRGDILEADQIQEVKRTPLVMVVDDSITMRRVTSRVLEHRGLEVITARDGLDAVEVMFERVPDLMLLDIEMPRMDGYELATHVRNDPRLKDVPMMMITSRSGEKHRQRARDIGVNDYLAKPYQEAELVQHVFDLLNMTSPEG